MKPGVIKPAISFFNAKPKDDAKTAPAQQPGAGKPAAGPIVGRAGVQYGLQPKLKAFQQDDDDNSQAAMGRSLQAQAEARKKKQEAERQQVLDSGTLSALTSF